MVSKYSVRDTQIFVDEVDESDNKTLMRASTLSVPFKTQRTIAKSLDPRAMDMNILRSITSLNNVINETYLNLTIKKIDELSGSERRVESYLNSRSPYIGMGAIDVFFINLVVEPGEKIQAEHIVFLNDLLTRRSNDIYLMPVVQFKGLARDDSIKTYSNFVSRMIHCKNSRATGSLNLGISIPSFFEDEELGDLYKLYSDENAEPTFISVDFSRTGMDNPGRMAVVNAVNEYYRKEDNENYFMYGFNVRAYKRKQVTPLSDEMFVARSGLNAVGAAHFPGGGPSKPVTQLNQLGVVFDRDDYHFHPLTEEKHMESFLQWSDDFGYRFDIHNNLPGDGDNIKSAVKKYNLYKENEEFFDISKAIRKNDKPLLMDMLVKGVEPPQPKVSINPSQRTLDFF